MVTPVIPPPTTHTSALCRPAGKVAYEVVGDVATQRDWVEG
ncbi:MAG: hypothetical protein ABR600_09335 [Actinomycetota bacterium]